MRGGRSFEDIEDMCADDNANVTRTTRAHATESHFFSGLSPLRSRTMPFPRHRGEFRLDFGSGEMHSIANFDEISRNGKMHSIANFETNFAKLAPRPMSFSFVPGGFALASLRYFLLIGEAGSDIEDRRGRAGKRGKRATNESAARLCGALADCA